MEFAEGFAAIQARNEAKGTAEVTILVGEGQNRKSVTRHVHLNAEGFYVGRNPDDGAIAMLNEVERAEAELQTLYDALEATIVATKDAAKMALKKIDDFLKRIEWSQDRVAELPPVFAEAARRVLYAGCDLDRKAIRAAVKENLETAKTQLAATSDALKRTKEEAEALREATPRQVIFRVTW